MHILRQIYMYRNHRQTLSISSTLYTQLLPSLGHSMHMRRTVCAYIEILDHSQAGIKGHYYDDKYGRHSDALVGTGKC